MKSLGESVRLKHSEVEPFLEWPRKMDFTKAVCIKDNGIDKKKEGKAHCRYSLAIFSSEDIIRRWWSGSLLKAASLGAKIIQLLEECGTSPTDDISCKCMKFESLYSEKFKGNNLNILQIKMSHLPCSTPWTAASFPH